MKINSKLKWILILLGVIVLGLLFQTREGFNPATERPSPSDPSLLRTIKSYANVTMDSDPKIGKYMSAIQSYYDTKFLPEKTSNSTKVAEFVNGQTDTDIDKATLTRILDYVFLTTDSTGTTAPPTGPTGPTGTTESAAATGATGSASSSPPDTSSSSTPPPSSSSQFSKFAQRVWGPAFVELGQGDGNGNGDSTKTTTYPELLGGLGDRYEGGAGPGEGKIQFPSLDSLGLNANANFFPFSRSPGDMDMIMDPYRVSKSFSAASYSPKPEPAPFLADFSKFQ